MPVMAAARTLESPSRPHSRSLLQTRSLRDLQALPPPPVPKKSHRRMLQVNGLHTVREVCPSISEISQSSRANQGQSPCVQRQSPNFHVQVSPFIAAPRPSFDTVPSQSISPYTPTRSHQKTQSGLNLAVETKPSRPAATRPATSPEGQTSPGLRNPPIDPRRARRYCSDFGLGRSKSHIPAVARSSPSPPFADNSSLASTPLQMYTETESDSDASSVDHAFGFSFPEPPPIDETLHIRRMHSSPMFGSEETDVVEHSLRKRRGATIEAPEVSPLPHDKASNLSTDYMNSNLDGELDVSRGTVEGSPLPRVGRPALFATSSTPRKSNFPTPTPPSGRGNDTFWRRATTTPTPREQHWSKLEGTSTLSHSRSASSRDTPTSEKVHHFPSELSKPMDRLDLSIKKLKAHGPQQHHIEHPVAPVRWETQVYTKHETPHLLTTPSLASAGRQKPTYRPHVLGQVLATNVNTEPRNPSSRDLGTPFNHRPTHGQHILPMSSHHSEQQVVPKSFMDITPEQEVERGSRSRIRKLLARASVGVFGWGKSHGSKRSTLK